MQTCNNTKVVKIYTIYNIFRTNELNFYFVILLIEYAFTDLKMLWYDILGKQYFFLSYEVN